MRIVSLCPSITETLIGLGLESQLVGVTRFCIHPAEVVAKLEKVGGTKTPELDRIRALAPDFIFMNEEENRREDYEALAADFRIDSTLPKKVREVPALLRHLGALTGTEALAEQQAQALEQSLEDLAANPAPAFRYAYLIWREPWMAVNRDTYVADLWAQAGGIGVFDDHPDRYPIVRLAELADAAPDLLLLPDEPFPFQEKHRAELAGLLPHTAIRLVSGDDCCWHGLRTRRGVELVGRLAKEPFKRAQR
ncbi:MAG: ABC transporter substrate-binding protein [Deltaproteobacteria bacterium]|nr:ABC transporter substrate-binding protein [Deltaproteobacteria bacterium]